MRLGVAALAALLSMATPAVAYAQDLDTVHEFIARKEYAPAAAALEQRLADAPDDAQARFLLARVHAWNGEPARALPLFEALLARDPGNTDYLLGYGQALTWSGQPGRAVEVLSRAQALAPGYADVAQALAQARAATAPVPGPIPAQADDTPVSASVAGESSRSRRVAVSARHDDLDNGYDDWSAVRLDVASTQRGRFGGYGALTADRRFDLTDYGLEAGLIVPLGESWTFQPEAGAVSDADFLPHYYVDARVLRTFAHGWIGAASLRTSNYPDTRVDRLALGAERYWSAWRAAYNFNLTRLRGTHSPSHDLRLARGYGERGEVGVQLAFGREAALTGTGVTVSDVRAGIVFGRHAFSPAWSLTWNLGVIDQGDLYTRYGGGLGLERRF